MALSSYFLDHSHKFTRQGYDIIFFYPPPQKKLVISIGTAFFFNLTWTFPLNDRGFHISQWNLALCNKAWEQHPRPHRRGATATLIGGEDRMPQQLLGSNTFPNAQQPGRFFLVFFFNPLPSSTHPPFQIARKCQPSQPPNTPRIKELKHFFPPAFLCSLSLPLPLLSLLCPLLPKPGAPEITLDLLLADG